MTVAAPAAPGRPGQAGRPASAMLRFLADLGRWRDGRRAELDELDQAALDSPERAAAHRGHDPGDDAVAGGRDPRRRAGRVWDSGRVGPAELAQLSTLVWGRLGGTWRHVARGLAARGLPAVRRAGGPAAPPALAGPGEHGPRRAPALAARDPGAGPRPGGRRAAGPARDRAAARLDAMDRRARRRRRARPARRRRRRPDRAAGGRRRGRRARPDRRGRDPARRRPGPGPGARAAVRAAPRAPRRGPVADACVAAVEPGPGARRPARRGARPGARRRGGGGRLPRPARRRRPRAGPGRAGLPRPGRRARRPAWACSRPYRGQGVRDRAGRAARGERACTAWPPTLVGAAPGRPGPCAGRRRGLSAPLLDPHRRRGP